MNIRSAIKNISFTRNEIKVIIFIVSVLIAGFSIKYYKYLSSDDKLYDFTGSDLEFSKRSMLLYDKSNDTAEDFTTEERKLMEDMQSLESENGESYFKQRNRIELTEKSVNINTASREELVALPGIGEAIAERIIVFRQQNPKGFGKIEDIMNVKGIGKKKFEDIKIYIKTE